MSEPMNNVNGQQISELCKNIIPTQNDSSLITQIQKLYGNCPVSLAQVSDEWYRIGGVVENSGKRVALDLIEWVERTYIECGQNLQTLIEHSLEHHYIATKQTGSTLHFVIQTGDRAEDYILLEIDKISEISDRLLINEDALPEDKEDIIDPLTPALIEGFAIGHSRYQYRSKTDIKLFMDTLSQHHAEVHPVQRFLNDWNNSTAAKSVFCQHWLILPYMHTGRYGEQIVNAEVINIQTKPMHVLENLSGKQGTSIHNLLTRFDRQAGYPFAWFFYMIKGKLVAPYNGEAVYQDITGDFAYLPAQDEAVLKAWIASPYNV